MVVDGLFTYFVRWAHINVLICNNNRNMQRHLYPFCPYLYIESQQFCCFIGFLCIHAGLHTWQWCHQLQNQPDQSLYLSRTSKPLTIFPKVALAFQLSRQFLSCPKLLVRLLHIPVHTKLWEMYIGVWSMFERDCFLFFRE